MQGWDDEKDEETEEFYKMTTCDADPGWIAYIIASKQTKLTISIIKIIHYNHFESRLYDRCENRGKSGLHRQQCQVTPGKRKFTESAAENNR